MMVQCVTVVNSSQFMVYGGNVLIAVIMIFVACVIMVRNTFLDIVLHALRLLVEKGEIEYIAKFENYY